MSKKSTAPIAGSIIPAFEAITSMKDTAKVALFKQAQDALASSFLTCGKIYAALGDAASKTLKLGGITDGSVSNAAYGAKAFKVADGKLKIHLGDKAVVFDEAAYDQLSFTQCRLIGQVTSEKTQAKFHKPSPDQLKEMLKHKGWEAELDSFRKDGLTAAERKAEGERLKAEEAARAAAHPAPRLTEISEAEFRAQTPAGQTKEAIMARSGVPSERLVVAHIGGEAAAPSNVHPFPAAKTTKAAPPAEATPYVHGGEEGDLSAAMELWQSIMAEMRGITDADKMETFLNTVKADLVELEEQLERMAA